MTWLKQVQDVAHALLLAQALRRHDRWSVAQLKRHQDRKLSDIVRHAAARSPFYRELYQGLRLQDRVELPALPITGKRLVMENFDRLVTDPRLKLETLEKHISRTRHDDYYLGNYRVLATTGTSGLRGVFVYDRSAWRKVLANTLRWHAFAGIRPHLPQRLRLCSIGADHPAHISRCLPASGNVGLFKLLRLNAAQPLSQLVAQLNHFQPQVLMPYPSISALLADEQLRGRLRIAPWVVTTHSEALTDDMRQRIHAAWGITAFNHYGLSEEPHVSCDCEAHAGLHVFEDLCLIEVVDEDNRPVPPGTLGAKYLLTNLYNRIQPLIRYEVTDLIAITHEPCPCGRPFARITQIAGRSEQALVLRGADGGKVTVSPIALLACLDAMPDVVEFEMRHGPAKITLTVVARRDTDQQALRQRLTEALTAVVRRLGAEPPPFDIAFRETIERRSERMGKLQQVQAV